MADGRGDEPGRQAVRGDPGELVLRPAVLRPVGRGLRPLPPPALRPHRLLRGEGILFIRLSMLDLGGYLLCHYYHCNEQVATFLELRETQPALVANDASDSAESIHSSNLGAPSVSYSPRLPSTPARSLLGSPPATPLRSSATPPSTPAAAAAVVPNSAAGYSTPAGTPHPVSYPSMSAWTEGIAMAAAGGASKPAAPAAPRLPGRHSSRFACTT